MLTRSLISLVAITTLSSAARADVDPVEWLKATATVSSDLQLRPAAAQALSIPLPDRPGTSVSMLQAYRHVRRFWISISEKPDESNAEVTEIVVGVMSVNIPGCTEANTWGLINALPFHLTRKSNAKEHNDPKFKFQMNEGTLATILGVCPPEAHDAVINAFGQPSVAAWDHWAWRAMAYAQSDFERAPDDVTADVVVGRTREVLDELWNKEQHLRFLIEDQKQRIAELEAGNNCAGGEGDMCQPDQEAITAAKAELARLEAELAKTATSRVQVEIAVANLDAEIEQNGGWLTWENVVSKGCSAPAQAAGWLFFDEIATFGTVGVGAAGCIMLRANALAVYPTITNMRAFTAQFWQGVAMTAAAGFAAVKELGKTCANPTLETKCAADQFRMGWAVAAVFFSWTGALIESGSALISRLFVEGLRVFLPGNDEGGGGGGDDGGGADGGGAGGGEGP